jgi:NADH-quinone oxidoreductase subunit N
MSPMDIAGVAAPELFLSAAALLLLLWGAFKARAGGVFTAAAVVALCAAAVVACVAPLGRAFQGGLILDQGAVYAKVVIYLASACAIPLGERWFAKRGEPRFEFPVLVIIAGLGMGMMVSAGDLISLFISVELQSLALYILAAFERNDGHSSEAGLKYFVLGSLSSGIMLYGASLAYGFAGSTRFDAIALAMSHGAGGGALLGLVFLICGLGFKVSAAPFHMWSPDVYEGAPTPVVGFLVGAPKLAAMVLLARLLTEGFGGAVMQWRQIIVAMAILSVGVGAYAGLRQSNLKRLWAYASIANIGYAMVGLAAGGAIGVQSMLIFMTLYVIDVTGFFACLAALSRDGRPMQTLGDMAGLARERPGLASAITFFALSGLGLPPFSGLWSKFYVFKAAIVSGLAPVAVIALIGSVIAAYYYLRLIKVMWLDPSAGPTDAPPADATAIGFAAALFSLPLVWFALVRLDPLTQAAANAIIRS